MGAVYQTAARSGAHRKTRQQVTGIDPLERRQITAMRHAVQHWNLEMWRENLGLDH